MTNRTVAVLLAAGLAACSSSTADAPAAITEHDFTADPTLAVGIDQVGVTFLEPRDAASSESDTGGQGVDEIPIDLPAAVNYTLGLDPDDGSGTIARVELMDGTRAVLLALTPAAPSGTVLLPPGRYTVAIHAAYALADAEGADHRTVFLRPPGEPVPVAFASGSGTTGATPADLRKLISTKSCNGCDLHGADLTNAQLKNARMTLVILDHAILSGANLEGAMMFKASLVGATIATANLKITNLTQADLRGSDVHKATLDHTILDHAKWTDGRICKSTSIGVCD